MRKNMSQEKIKFPAIITLSPNWKCDIPRQGLWIKKPGQSPGRDFEGDIRQKYNNKRGERISLPEKSQAALSLASSVEKWMSVIARVSQEKRNWDAFFPF